MDFPFKEKRNVMVFTCRCVLDKEADICYVTHDEDDGVWQFLCGQDHVEADARIVSLESIVDMDPSITVLADMPLGCGAMREDRSSQWKGFRK